uniref:Uncharacterized protein n=1 Tax=Romanomermis culicivorax TaxID=13658 RepID=A0A915JSZ0_ROMCU
MFPENATETVDRTTERTIVGAFYIVISTGMIIPYAMCMYIFATEKKFQGVPFYRTAFFMGIMDLGQLTCNGLYAGLCCLVTFRMPYMVEKFNNSFLCMCWYTYTMLTHLMAINRFVTVYWPQKVDDIFSYKITSVLIALSFLHGSMWFGVFMWPDVYEYFSTDDYSFMFDFTRSKSLLAVQMNGYEDLVHSIGMILWYSLTYIKLRIKWVFYKMLPNKKVTEIGTVVKSVYIRSQIVSESIAHNNRKENKVLLQAVVLCSMDIATIVTYLIVELLPHSRWTSLISNYVWLFCAGNCPLIYLTLNSVVRARFLKMFCKNRIVPTGSDGPLMVGTPHDTIVTAGKFLYIVLIYIIEKRHCKLLERLGGTIACV